jgi:hypothetical protein
MQKEIIKADDCRCFKCGEVLKALFKLKTANSAMERLDWSGKVNEGVVSFMHYGKRIYRHSKNCMKGKE